MTAQLTLSPLRYNTPEKLSAFYQGALARLKAMPGISAVAVATAVPYAKEPATGSFTIVGHPSLPGQPWPYASYNFVSNDFLRTMQIRLLRGRFFDPHDQLGSEPICVVDDLLARKYWPHTDPVGEQIDRDGYRVRIVGIVSHVRQQLGNVNEDGGYYQPLVQSPASSAVFLMRTSQQSAISPNQVRQVFRQLDSTQPVYGVGSMDSWAEQSLANRRIIAAVLEVFSSFALLLTAVGIYGVITYSVSQRTLEIGIRIALGAERIDILRLIVGQGLRLAIAGVLVGLGMAALLGNFFRDRFYAVSPTDPATYLTMTGVVLSTALIASALPASRASTMAPAVALKQ
jgi:predicted permease